MTEERAREINRWMLDHSWYSMGLKDEKPPSLQEVSLEEMIEATKIVKGFGSPTITCDNRLIAALYVAYHYSAPKDIDSADTICEAADGRMVVVVDKRFVKQEA